MLTIGILIPVYNEEEVLDSFYRQLCRVIDPLPYCFHLYFVNDGSRDKTEEILCRLVESDPRVQVIELSRNFGHQAALTAGLDAAEGDYVISMDGDGQHPPEMISEMINLAKAGYDVVLTQRKDDLNASTFKRLTSNLFYDAINRVGDTQVLPGGADFRLMSRAAVEGLKGMREYHRFLRGMVSWMGYRSVILPYEAPARLAGKSKYSLRKMLRLAADAVFSFSLVPLYMGITLGIVMLFLALAEMVYVLSFWISGHQSSLAPGWSSLMFVILVVGGILMILLGFVGVYIGFIFQEVKHRPIYLVRRMFSASKEQNHE
jgi:polyisoprenyl-phosphate glycosyltransferase